MSATPHSITEPLNFRGYLRSAPRAGWDFIAVLDVLLIVGMLFLHQSRFIYGSGADVELVQGQPGRLALEGETAVLTVRANDMIFFDGQKVAREILPQVLAEYVAEHRGQTALLLKVDRSIDLQTLFSLFETARQAGYARVQIASEPVERERSAWPDL